MNSDSSVKKTTLILLLFALVREFSKFWETIWLQIYMTALKSLLWIHLKKKKSTLFFIALWTSLLSRYSFRLWLSSFSLLPFICLHFVTLIMNWEKSQIFLTICSGRCFSRVITFLFLLLILSFEYTARLKTFLTDRRLSLWSPSR